jgi:phosphatidylglycerol lysyltransferase
LFPAFVIFLLGIVTILSVLTPPLAQRVSLLQKFIPSTAIYTSNVLMIYIGVALITIAAFLIRGLKNAWRLAVVFTSLSLIGHLLKGLDWEEASLAFAVLLTLAFTAKQYTARSNPRLINLALRAAVLAFVAVMIYSFTGFYFLEKRHFGIDFTWRQSLIYTLRTFFLQNNDLQPLTHFGREFITSTYALASAAWLFLLYALVRPFVKLNTFNQEKEKADALLQQYGQSSVDYFKVADDKLFYFSKERRGFVSYRIEKGFAIVLEMPVCAEDDKNAVLKEFAVYCKRIGVKTVYYRVDEKDLTLFSIQKKKRLLIGQEAILNLAEFELTGKDKKSLRNGLNSLQKKGFTTSVYEPPHIPELMTSLKAISDEWLEAYDRSEMAFAQGVFEEEELQQQPLVITKNAEGEPIAFLNIIPDYAPGECTYDLIRKTADAPGGCMDALIIELINWGKRQEKKSLNLGLAPMSGLEHSTQTLERLMRYAYEKIRRFRHYQGLRSFKEKYASQWLNKYLVYENDFDLLRLPAALKKAMRPVNKD